MMSRGICTMQGAVFLIAKKTLRKDGIAIEIFDGKDAS